MANNRNAPEVRTADSADSAKAVTADATPVRQSGPSNAQRVKAQKEWEKSDETADDTHVSVEPSEADYEKARTVGIGNEPELPPGIVRGN